MQVTKIEPVTKTRFKIYLNDAFAFVLHKGEMSRYKITEGSQLTQEQRSEILETIVLKRAKKRALYLLKDMDRTEKQLKDKLKQNAYPDEIIDQVIEYVKGLHYVEDEGYAERYIRNRMGQKSKKELCASLLQKGVATDVIQLAMENCYEDYSEKEAILNLLRKKNFHIDDATEGEKKKIYDYLMRKGFKNTDVRQVIQVSLWNA